MKRIYKNNDLAFNLTINNFPINKDLINSIEFKFYTLNQSNYIVKSQDDIDVYNQVILEWSELRKLEEGVLFYDYNLSLKNEEMNDGTEDTVNKIMTNYYIVTGNETIDINSDMANYYTKDEIDDLIANVEGGEVDLTKYYTKSQIDIKLNGYVQDDVLGSYYTKNEVNDLIDGLSTGDGEINLNNYYTKTEVNNLIPTDYIKEIPSEYITETELNAKGYLTQHQSLEEYAKLTDIPNEVYYFNYGVVGSSDFNDMSNAISKGYIINVYNIPNMEFINNTVFDVSSKSSTSIQLVGTRCSNGATNGNKTDVNITTITITLNSDNTRTYKANSPQLKMIGSGTKFLADDGNYKDVGNIYNFDPMLFSTSSDFDKLLDALDNGKTICMNAYPVFCLEYDFTNITLQYIYYTVNKENTITFNCTKYIFSDDGKSQRIDESITFDKTVNYEDRISALETELNGVSQQITELNNMVV